MLLPALLTDLLFAGKERDAKVWMEETNPAMAELAEGYAEVIFRRAGLGGGLRATGNQEEALRGADCVIYAGDPQAASRFFQDRSALESDNEEDPGLTDQARVNGGIEGLMHTLRAGEAVLSLCEAMEEACPDALVINLGQPVARTTKLFLDRGFRCCGLGRTPLKGANGLDTMARGLMMNPEELEAVIAGLPGFSFLLSLKSRKDGMDWMPKLRQGVKNGELGELTKRWLSWWDALAVGDVTDHAEFLPAQPDYRPEEKPAFGETVERRKERIRYMNTVREQGADGGEGAMAQLLLLSKAPPVRPVRLALAVLRKEDGRYPAVTHENRGDMAQLPAGAIVETELKLEAGEPAAQGIRVPPALAETLAEIDDTNRLAARAATGDREALRECVETDPALSGLDRLYCQEVVRALIRMHEDVLPRWREDA